MRRVTIPILIVFSFLLATGWLYAQTPTRGSGVNHIVPRFPRKPGFPPAPQLMQRAQAAPLAATAAPNFVPVDCPPEAQYYEAICGSLPVPLDRKHLAQGTIPIYFELYQHSGGTSESAILVNFGGPGNTTTGFRSYALYLFGANLVAHDLLLIDDRGRGSSGTIQCDELQHGTAPFQQALANCAAQLGTAASRYGTGDIAQDTEDVRAALGYDQVDYYGFSYGAADISAYATRFGQHLRSIILDSPAGTPMLDESRFVFERYRTGAESRMLTLDCQRSPTCSRDHPFPQQELEALLWRVRLFPVEGDAFGANGNLVHVRIDEEALLNYVIDRPTGNFISTGEVLAAATALFHGDSKPLLRLGAEGYFPLQADNGDATLFSVGAHYASPCVDMHPSWSWKAPAAERLEQFDNAVSSLPFWYFAPFSKYAPTGLTFDVGRFGTSCLTWEKPTASSPVVPPHATYPTTPTLVLSGDLDNLVPTAEAREVAALFPGSVLVSVPGVGHTGTVFTNGCAASLATEFIENLQVGDTSCATTPQTVWPSVGRFPLLARDAQPADVDSGGENQVGLAERKVVTVAVATATDAIQRSAFGWGTGAGLRAGSFSTDYDGWSVWTTILSDCVFSNDVIVNGTVTWNMSGAFTADLTVSGSGTAGGSLHVDGTWQAPGPVGEFKISGTLGGKQVALRVPEA